MAKRKLNHCLHKPRSAKAFVAWLASNGAELLPQTNRYELVRFRGTAGLSVIYTNDRGRPHKMTGQAELAWRAFLAGDTLDLAPQSGWIADAERRPIAISDADLIDAAGRGPITIAFLMERDAVPMREASARLFSLEREGKLTPSGGGPGEALLWRAAEASHAS